MAAVFINLPLAVQKIPISLLIMARVIRIARIIRREIAHYTIRGGGSHPSMPEYRAIGLAPGEFADRFPGSAETGQRATSPGGLPKARAMAF
jgi:hypothetical protein